MCGQSGADRHRAHFGFTKFSVLAHDRGARVAHRLALDHPDKVERMCLLDIAPTLYMYEGTNMMFVSLPWSGWRD
jgi:haloacetate dehalogenase